MTDTPSTRIATIEDVAQEAGVSIATVSRVINKKGYVKTSTYDRVVKTMETLGFVANPHARGLRGGSSSILGVLVSDVSNPFAAEVIRGIETEVAASSYHLLLYTTLRQPQKESEFVGTLMQGLVDGLILIVPRSADTYLADLRRRHFPYVVVDNQFELDVGSTLVFDYEKGAFEATCYLLELGHRRIGLISGSPEYGFVSIRQRLAGYRAALEHFAVPFDPALIQEGDFFRPAGFAAANKLLQLDEPPTAIFAMNDSMALGAIDAIRDGGHNVPEYCSVIGFGDFSEASQAYPPLTTIRQHIVEAGRLATQALINLVQRPDLPLIQTKLKAELIERGTCGPPRRPSELLRSETS